MVLERKRQRERERVCVCESHTNHQNYYTTPRHNVLHTNQLQTPLPVVAEALSPLSTFVVSPVEQHRTYGMKIAAAISKIIMVSYSYVTWGIASTISTALTIPLLYYCCRHFTVNTMNSIILDFESIVRVEMKWDHCSHVYEQQLCHQISSPKYPAEDIQVSVDASM